LCHAWFTHHLDPSQHVRPLIAEFGATHTMLGSLLAESRSAHTHTHMMDDQEIDELNFDVADAELERAPIKRTL
jgi:hypothetical protein